MRPAAALALLALLAGPPAAAADAAREALVASLARGRERPVRDERVLEAMRRVPRHEFVPPAHRPRAYDDAPLPIGYGQTISQPYIVGMMSELLAVKPGDKVFEVGTGSGYQAAVLDAMGVEVWSIEIVPELARRAAADLERLGYRRVRVKAGDGYRGWPQAAPFDAIIVTCAPDHVPPPLVEQLKLGGRLVIPVGPDIRGPWSAQELLVLTKTAEGLKREKALDVRFVPMRGEARRERPR